MKNKKINENTTPNDALDGIDADAASNHQGEQQPYVLYIYITLLYIVCTIYPTTTTYMVININLNSPLSYEQLQTIIVTHVSIGFSLDKCFHDRINNKVQINREKKNNWLHPPIRYFFATQSLI